MERKVKYQEIGGRYLPGAGYIDIIEASQTFFVKNKKGKFIKREKRWYVVGYDAWKLCEGRDPNYATYEADLYEEARKILKEVYFPMED